MQKVATANSALRSGIQASGFAFHTFRYDGPTSVLRLIKLMIIVAIICITPVHIPPKTAARAGLFKSKFIKFLFFY